MATLEGSAHYAGFLLATVEGFGLRPKLFMPFLLILSNFWWLVLNPNKSMKKKEKKNRKKKIIIIVEKSKKIQKSVQV